jgi:hypothetical protein
VGYYTGRVSEIRLEVSGQWEIYLICPGKAIPSPGQYLLASDPTNRTVALGTPLFISEEIAHGFWANPLHPVSWGLGTSLDLIGPFGHGFTLPRNVQRLGLVAIGETIARIKPIITSLVNAQTSVTLFTDLTLPRLPEAVEISPLVSLKMALDWPDFLVLDVPLSQLNELRDVFGLGDEVRLPCPAQVLITTPVPCAGMARCGACAVQTRRGWRLVCEDGPVFELSSLQW